MSPTSVSQARSGFPGRAWRRFRRWRRTRPFWGGLLLVISGVEIFLTTQMSLGGLSLQLGPTGFLSWLIPTVLVVCGVLAWATPGQRLFYAIVAAVTAVFSLIGVNLGGFFLGLVFGILGSGLVFAWAPGAATALAVAGDAATAPGQPGAVDEADTGELPTAGRDVVPGLDDDAAAARDPSTDELAPAPSGSSAEEWVSGSERPVPAPRAGDAVSGSPAGEWVSGSERPVPAPRAGDAASASATDQAAGSSADESAPGPDRGAPGAEGRHAAAPAGTESVGWSAGRWAPAPRDEEEVPAPEHGSAAGEERPTPADGGEKPGQWPLPRRESPRFYTVIGLLLALATGVAVGARVATPAYAAAPCPKPTGTAAPKPGQTSAPPPAASPTPTAAKPTPTPTEEERRTGIIGGIIDGITDIFDGDSDEKPEAAAAPAATPTPTPTPTATPSRPTTAKPSTVKPKPGDCPSSPGAEAEDEQPPVPLLEDDSDVPMVNRQPSMLTGTKLTMWGLRLEGIYTLHTAAGDVRSLKFTMRESLVETFALRIPQDGNPLLITSNTLTVSGDVAFYTTRFVGWIAGIKLTLTPDSPLPPNGIPLTLPKIAFDDPQIQLMYVSCNELRAPTLHESFVAPST